MLKCMRVEDIQGKKRYFCINCNGATSVFSKPEMIKKIQQGEIMNASTFIRGGTICIRVDGAIKEKVTVSNSADSIKSIEDKVVSQIIKNMQRGLVHFNVTAHQFLEYLELPDFILSNEAYNLVPQNLIQKAKDICNERGQQVYIMGIQAEGDSGYDILFATTNKQRGAAAIQDHIKNKVISASTEKEISTEEVKCLLANEQRRVFVHT